MTSKLFDSVTFEPDNLPTIIPPGGTIQNNFPAFGLQLGQADEWQAYLLYKGPPHAVVSGSSQFFGASNLSATGNFLVMVPPYATHAQIGCIAAGAGDVDFETTYTVEISNPATTADVDALSGAKINWGPSDDQALALGLSHTGAFQQKSITFSRDADVRVSAVCFRFFRRSTSI